MPNPAPAHEQQARGTDRTDKIVLRHPSSALTRNGLHALRVTARTGVPSPTRWVGDKSSVVPLSRCAARRTDGVQRHSPPACTGGVGTVWSPTRALDTRPTAFRGEGT